MVSMILWLPVMQENAPAHAATSTMEDMSQVLIQPISWPANSPDLNPIEAIWSRMKGHIQRQHPNMGCGKQRTPDSLCNILKEAWDSVYSEDLVRLIHRMPVRCHAMINADEGPTRY
ncbi:Bgt-50483 [Blumeria graminis f. sp. tritici]|uniref:Bgt-50483 n=1 Tax=Blumeria graminis f. sp. tritici TaxID=62690 RepID=A0A9X9L8Z1_BLUGR|nr:Bgt-50483 [Blumeria graminis f. sp. tritici]